jgi:hypothetical protein
LRYEFVDFGDDGVAFDPQAAERLDLLEAVLTVSAAACSIYRAFKERPPAATRDVR